ncbi:18.1 kDa class I heat shock protein-like [Juglans regia]|uniref:18.1 kDa class I heat shock protein-like n=2 Tax=Juglans regia TaxID=51240 RepID=A0A2I4DEB5_JUGRE|nr:18.1 kDa class I heat shock protein-like [Juglans regia]
MSIMNIPNSVFGGRSFEPLNLEAWDPFEEFHDFRRSLTIPQTSFPNETTTFVSAKVDWKETPEAHVLKISIPGLKKEEVKVEIEGDSVLCITGERKMEKKEKTERWQRTEQNSGKFVRRLRLPKNGDACKVRACLDNEVLTVTIPKEETKKHLPRYIPISDY